MNLKRLQRVMPGLIIIFFFFSFVSAAEAAGEAEPITVGVPADRCPMFYCDPVTNEIMGIGVDLMQIAAEKAGYRVSFKVVREETLKDALDNDAYDIVMPFGGPVPSTSGEPTIVSENLLETPFTLVTAEDRELPRIDRLRVGMLTSLGAGAETVSQLYPGIKISFYETMPECVRALRRGEVDALLHNSYVWSYILQKPSYRNLMIQPTDVFSMDFKVGTSDTPRGRELIERLNTGIRAIPATSRQAVILDYTSRKLYRYDFYDYFYQYGVLIAAFFIIIIIEIYNYVRLLKEKRISDEASKAKSMFLANMSHEIRTPINSIMGMGELISRDTDDPKLRQYAFSINNSANSLLCLVNDILDYSRMEAGKLKLRNNSYHLANLLTDVNMMIKERAESKGLAYDISINPDTPEEMIGDETRLKQVMINLLTNGVKYTNFGSVRLSIDFSEAGEDSVDLIITVSDTGIGMKQEELDRLFKAFERLDEDRNRTVEGTGLGMSIVKQILDAMGSVLRIESEYGKGSEFSFAVRQKVSDWDPIGDYEFSAKRIAMKQSAYSPGFIAPDAEILYVDDTEMNLVVLKGLLMQTKVRVDTAASGRQGLALLEKKKYDVLLIDHRMPGMDGVELIGRIKADSDNPNSRSIAIALTANVVEGERETCLDAGFDDFLEKPVNGKRLEEMLVKYLPAEKLLREDSAPENSRKSSAQQAADPLSLSDTDTMEGEAGADTLQKLQEQGLIDIKEGIEYAGSEELFKASLIFFRDSTDKKADELDSLFREGNIKDYTVKVHGVKSTARIIGAENLAKMARDLEMAGNKEDIDFIKNHHDALIEEYRRYRDITV